MKQGVIGRDNKYALIFLVKFIVLYFTLNTIYGLYIEWYLPSADPITVFVSRNTASLLSAFHDNIQVDVNVLSKYVGIVKDGKTIVNVFEGCNGINVLIVFIVFVIAFSKKWYRYWLFILVGLSGLYLINLIRVTALFWVARYSPGALYFYHKFLFTGIIYAMVFLLWYLWVKENSTRGSRDTAA